ncbi:MAG: hypothetical protein ACRC6D_09955 [Aeromonas sp.]
MSHERFFNFIYFGFVGDAAMRRPAIELPEARYLLSTSGLQIKAGSSLKKTELRALKSVYFLSKSLSERSRDDDEKDPDKWPEQTHFLRSMMISKNLETAFCIDKVKSDLDQFNVFCDYYIALSEQADSTEELQKFIRCFISKIDEKDGQEEIKVSRRKKHVAFIKTIADLLSHEINEKSYTLDSKLKEKSHHYITTAIALKLMSDIGIKKSPTEEKVEYGVSTLHKELSSLYLKIIERAIFLNDTEELFTRLQAFIDMFILGVCYSKKQMEVRREYMSSIVESARIECLGLAVKSVSDRVGKLTDDYEGSFLEYMAKNRFNTYAKYQWYNELYRLAQNEKKYCEFIMVMMSFLPKKKFDVKKIITLSKKALEKRAHDKDARKTKQPDTHAVLNVKVKSETMSMLVELQTLLEITKLEAVMQAVELMHSKYSSSLPPRRRSRSSNTVSYGVTPDMHETASHPERNASPTHQSASSRRRTTPYSPRLSLIDEVQETENIEKNDAFS